MQVKIKRLDETLPLPTYQSAGAVGFDFCARERVIVKPQSLAVVPLNVIVQVPTGYLLLVALRSSTPLRKSLLMPNGVGIIDQDYHGPTDELKVLVYNFSHQLIEVTRGERIAQGILVKIEKVSWQEALQSLKETNRGGYGSTGNF